MKQSEVIILGVILLSFIVGIFFYPRVPEQVASHWNSQGEGDVYLPKFWGLFLIPLASLVIFVFFMFILPRVDPLRDNIEKFRRYYDEFVGFLMGFLFYLQLLTVLWNCGFKFSLLQFLAPALGALFYLSGTLLGNAEPNWSIGIRTPWTLGSEEVWKKTHHVSGVLLKAAGAVTALGIIFPKYMLFLILGSIVVFGVFTIGYSYREFQRVKEKEKK
jgi:uncharacterized membrane protein